MKIKLVVGLGNPGKEYKYTRHNMGFMVLDEIAKRLEIYKWKQRDGALYFESEKSADNWHSRHLEYLFTHGGHRFYK